MGAATRAVAWAVLAAGMAAGGAGQAVAGDRPAVERLGGDVKLRVLVDKVLQKHAGWKTEPWMVRQAAEAGFNVYSPRQGAEDLAAVRRVTAWCRQNGLYHMPWMRGTLAAPRGTAEDQRMVWADGTVSGLYSPNSDALWAWMTERIVAYARLAGEDSTLLGVFLDYENYQPTNKPNCYELSYDLGILRRFAKARGLELPSLPPAGRKGWLERQNLAGAFDAFQVAHWRERCRRLRQAVDRHAPAFRFCVYPAPGTKFIVEAIYPEWATKRAPLLLADACTYGRPQFLPLADSLAYNRAKLLRRRQTPASAGINFRYLGGIDPAVRGADPEFSGKNAVMISHVTDGYWIFYEGPTYTADDHRRYWEWFTWANRAIAAGRWAARNEPRRTAREWNFRLWYELKKAPADLPARAAAAWAAAAAGPPGEFPPLHLRGENLLLLKARAGRAVAVTLRHVPVSRYRNLLGWELRTLSRRLLDAGTIPPGRTGAVRFTPRADGVYLLAASAGSCAYSVVGCDVPVGLYAGPGCAVSVIHGAGRLAFDVPAGTRRFTVRAAGHGRETVRVDVFDPAGRRVAAAQTTPRQETVRLGVDVSGRAAGRWSLSLGRADEGTLEDASVSLAGLPAPVLCFPARR